MKAYLTKKLWFALLILGFSILPSGRGLSAVIVYDRVTTVGTPVYFKSGIGMREQIWLSTLSPGMYFVNITTEEGNQMVVKAVKQ